VFSLITLDEVLSPELGIELDVTGDVEEVDPPETRDKGTKAVGEESHRVHTEQCVSTRHSSVSTNLAGVSDDHMRPTAEHDDSLQLLAVVPRPWVLDSPPRQSRQVLCRVCWDFVRNLGNDEPALVAEVQQNNDEDITRASDEIEKIIDEILVGFKIGNVAHHPLVCTEGGGGGRHGNHEDPLAIHTGYDVGHDGVTFVLYRE
jgi:hypothetical protein